MVAKDLWRAFGPNGDLLFTMSKAEMLKAVALVRAICFHMFYFQALDKKEATTAEAKQQLKTYSSFLSNFQSSCARIPIPGQYDGTRYILKKYCFILFLTSPPAIASTVLIENFDARVLVLSSARRPKRVTIRFFC
jgi:hypothetical protein